MQAFERGDTRPWHRQFWPWFLILLPSSVVVAGLTTLYIANRYADDLVVDDYYREGLAINRQLDKKLHADEMRLSARLLISGERVRVKVGGPLADPALSLSLSHPLEADQDFQVPLSRVEPGLYQGRLARRVAPHWHWTLGSPHDGQWRLDGELGASNFDDVTRD